MKDIFGFIAEARIKEAQMKGELKNLPGEGKPLKIQDLSFLAPELRAAYIILKNSGYLEQNNSKNSNCQTFLIEEEDLNLLEPETKKPKENIKEKIYKYNVSIDSRRRRF